MDGVIVLGAGLAGLGCARQLPGARVFEAAAHPGGHAYSHPMGGVHFDQGAHISHSKDEEFVRLTGQAAGEVCAISPSVVRNHWAGGWIGYPVQNHLADLPLDDRVRGLTDLVAAHASPRGEPSDYREWCVAQYGEHLTRTFYDAFTAKYWRVPPERLATDWLGGRLLPSQLPRIVRGALGLPDDSQAVFARFRYPARGGFFGFFAPLYRGLDVRYGERAVEVDARRRTVSFASGRTEQFDSLVSTIPLPKLIGIVKDTPADVRAAAGRLRHTQLLCVNMIIDRPRLTDCHWFYVYDQDVEAARVSVPSNLAPGCVPAGRTAIQAEVFRRDDEPLDPALLVERTVAQIGRLLGFTPADVRQVGHVHVPHAYVISDHDRAAAVEFLRAWLADRGVLTAGLYGRWKYVWSDEAYRQGREAAAEVLARRGTARRAG
jgi:protoporphyrinogen oxidase